VCIKRTRIAGFGRCSLGVMRSRFRGRAIGSVVVGIVAACSFKLPRATPGDDVTPPPDAGPCQELGSACIGTTLRECTMKDMLPTDTTCAWGCLDGPPPHCGLLSPSGGAVMPSDLLPNGDLQDTTIMSAMTITIDGEDGSIGNGADGVEVRDPGTGVNRGIDFIQRGNVSIFRFKSLTIKAKIHVIGNHSVALLAIDTMTITNGIDVSCSSSTTSGPGGFDGGGRASDGSGSGGGKAGSGGSGDCSGGAGASYGAAGGQGGSSDGTGNPPAGAVSGDLLIAALVGGAGGGGGGGNANDRGSGGGGGGALQLAANQRISFTMNGAIDAGGCGGIHGNNKSCGGGGGAGGAILIEAAVIELADMAALGANGGGGGCGSGNGDGSDGALSTTRAKGGSGNANGGSGGAAGPPNLTGNPGDNDGSNGAGGGGGVGWIRIDTLTGTATIGPNVVISPALGDATSSQGSAIIQ